MKLGVCEHFALLRGELSDQASVCVAVCCCCISIQ